MMWRWYFAQPMMDGWSQRYWRRQRGKLHEQYDNKDNKARKGVSDTRDGERVYDNDDNYDNGNHDNINVAHLTVSSEQTWPQGTKAWVAAGSPW